MPICGYKTNEIIFAEQGVTMFETQWEDDKLGRQETAKHLTDMLLNRFKRYSGRDSIVINIDARWGLGKTFLLKNWHQELKNNDYLAVYVDAWSNDFTDQPLLTVLGEMNEQLGTSGGIKEVTRAGKEVFKCLGRLSLHLPALALTGKDADELAKLAAGGTDSTTADLMEDYKAQKEAIIEFKKALRNMQGEFNVEKPIFIFVDELDRCRPSYAIEMLEVIKHLFGVPGVYFVLATARKQMSYTVKSLYGNEFDGEGYLGRFFDLEYRLPEPDNYKFATHLFETNHLLGNEKFVTPFSEMGPVTENPDVDLFALNATWFDLALRDQEYCARILEVLVDSWPFDSLHLGFLLPLIACSLKTPDCVDFLGKGQITPQMLEKTKPAYFNDDYSDGNDSRSVKKKADFRSIVEIYCKLIRGEEENSYGYLVQGGWRTMNVLAESFKLERSADPLRQYASIVRQLGDLAPDR